MHGAFLQSVHTDLCPSIPVRLVTSGTYDFEGRVEVCVINQWGSVCDDFWSNTDAIVICRQLGISTTGNSTIKYLQLAILAGFTNPWYTSCMQESWQVEVQHMARDLDQFFLMMLGVLELKLLF